VDYETEEQQVEALKQWWKDNGRSVIVGIVLGVGVIGGWQAYGRYNQAQAEEASEQFASVMFAVEDDNAESNPVEIAAALQDNQSGSLYATLASMTAARVLIQEGDLDGAAAKLQWAVDHSPEAAVAGLASIRLARVLGASGKHDEALAILPVNPPEGYIGVTEEIRGDVLAAKGDAVAARAAYQKALDNAPTMTGERIVNIKMEDLADATSADQS